MNGPAIKPEFQVVLKRQHGSSTWICCLAARSRVRAVLMHRPLRDGGHGEYRALAAPMARLRKKCRRQVPQVQPKTPGIPRAMVLRLYVISSVHRACWPPSLRDALASSQVGISVGRPGPRDLTVRISVVRRRRNPRCNGDTPIASRLNVRDDREAPLLSRRDGRQETIVSGKKKQESFG